MNITTDIEIGDRIRMNGGLEGTVVELRVTTQGYGFRTHFRMMQSAVPSDWLDERNIDYNYSENQRNIDVMDDCINHALDNWTPYID